MSPINGFIFVIYAVSCGINVQVGYYGIAAFCALGALSVGLVDTRTRA